MSDSINILITGIPRSGTTLLTHLLDKHSRSIVLTEPTWIKSLRATSKDHPSTFLKLLENQITNIKKMVENNQAIEVLVDSRDNNVPQNFYIRGNDASKSTIENIKKHVLKKFPKNHSKQPLIIKVNTYFTAILKQIVVNQSFKTIALIREPVAVLKSWRSLDIPVSRGQLKIAELFSDEVKNMAKIDDLLIRQVKLLDWFYQQYHSYQDHIQIVKYENLIANPEQTINNITQPHNAFDESLNSMNNSAHYDHSETELIQTAIKTHAKHYAHFYDL